MHKRQGLAGLILFLMGTLCPGPCTVASAGPVPGLSVSADPVKTTVGRTVDVSLSYSLPEGAKLSSPLDVRGIEDLTVTGREVGQKRIVLKVMADRLDELRIGSIELDFIDRDGRKGSVRSGELTVQVVSNLKDGSPEDLRPIKGIVPLQSPWIRRVLIAGAMLLILAAIAGFFLLARRRKGRALSAAPEDPPHVRVEREIDALLKENLFEQGLQKEFYFRFSEIVRRYLEGVRGFPAAEYTTEEIACHILEQDRPVLTVLRRADFVKFADALASPEEKDADVRCILAHVTMTALEAERPENRADREETAA